MKKRILSFLLMLVMVVSMVPVMATATAAEETAEAPTADDLYVTDGLVALFDAFGKNDASVDLANGTWTAKYSKTGTAVATIKGVSWWEFRANGGFGYDMTQTELNSNWGNVEINFDINLLNEDAFTFETVINAYGAVDAEGNRSYTEGGWGNYFSQATFINVGNLRTMQFGGHTKYSVFMTRFMYTPNADGWHSNQSAGSGIGDRDAIAAPGVPVGLAVTYTSNKVDTAIYTAYVNGNSILSYNSKEGNGNSYWTGKYHSVLATGSLKIAGGFPSTVYAARVYDKVLSVAERNQNHFADLAKFYGLDLSSLAGLDADTLKEIFAAAATLGFNADKATAQAALEAAVLAATTFNGDDLYVTDGLVIWLDGSDASTVNLGANTWASKVGDVVATIGGTWKTGRNPGSYRFDMQNCNLDYGLFLPITALPKEDYTIDMLTMTRGYTKNADGVTSDLTDGLYTRQASSFIIGPLMCDTFGQERIPGCANYDKDCAWNDAAWYYTNGIDKYTKPGDSANANWSYAGGYGWGTRNRAFTYNGDFPSSIALTLDTTGTTKAQYTFVQNGSAIHSFNGVAHSFKEVVPVDTATMKWVMFRAFPVEIYQFRVYNRVLSQNELNRNHLADLANYLGLDLSGLVDCTEDQINEIAGALSTIGFNADKETAQFAIDRVVHINEIIEESVTAYDKLYAAKDNLIVLLTAFDAKNDLSLDLATGRWYNKADKGETFATLFDTTSATSWEYAKSGKGIEYSFATIGDLVGNLTTIGVRIPTADFTDSDMASEYVFAVNPTLDENGNQVKITMIDGKPSHGGQWGVYNGNGKSNFSFAGLHICHFTLSDNPQGASMQDRIFYAPGPWECGWTVNVNGADQRKYEYDYLFGTKDGWNEDVVTLGFNRDVTERADTYNQADFAVILNGATRKTTNNVSNPNCHTQYTFYTIDQLNQWTAGGATSSAADAFFGIPSTVYAVRVYDKVLTSTEMALNHAVDLMAFYGLDVSKIANVPEGVLSSIGPDFAGFGYEASDADKAAMQAAIDKVAAIYEEMVAAQELSEYDNLYVKDGMTLLLSAYSADDLSLALGRGMWYNKLDFSFATLLDGDNAEKFGWKAATDGGIYYRIPTVADFNSVKAKTGMTLPVSALNDGDFTVEFVFDPLGISGEDGVVVPHTGASGESQWGAYTGNRSAFSIGGLQMTMFHYSTLSTGGSMAVRPFYYINGWESGANGKVTFADRRDIFGTTTNAQSEWKQGVLAFTVDRTVADGADYTLTEFVGTVGNESFTVNNGTGVNDGKLDHTFYSLSVVVNPFDAFIGFPAQVYAVRVYDRALTAAEKAQNHFADVAAYLGLNTFGVEFLEGAKAAAFYELFADADFTSDKDVLQNKIFGALAALDVLMGAGETEATVTEDDLIITATYGAASMPLGSLAMLGFTVEMGVVLAPITSEDMTAADITVVRGENAFTPSLETSLVLVNYSSEEESAYVTGENFFAPMGVMFRMDLSYKDVVVANGLEAMVEAPLVFRGFIAITDAEGNTSIIYNDDVTSKSFYEFADYYVNDFEGDKYLMHEYNTNETLVGIIGAENVEREIGLGVDADDQTQTNDKDAALGDIPETGITGAEDIKQDGEDDVASTQVDKIRPTADSNASYSFVSTVDGKVRLVIEYVAKAYTLGDRAITIKVDGYQTMTVVLSDSVTGINTDRNNHGFYVVEFEVAAGTHNIVIGAAEGARAVEIFSIAVDAQ